MNPWGWEPVLSGQEIILLPHKLDLLPNKSIFWPQEMKG